MEDLEAQELSKITEFVDTLALEILHHSGVWPSLPDLAILYASYDGIDEAVNEFMICLHEQSRKQHFNWNW